MAKNANVTKVTRNPNNKEGGIVTLSNGDTLWLQLSYIKTVLEASFIDDCRPTALIGASVSYDMKKYKKGDYVFDKKGIVKTGETVQFKFDGERPVNLLFNEVEGHIGEYDKARMLSTAVANAMVKSAGAFAPIKRVAAIAESAPEPETSAVEDKVAAGEDDGEPTI